MADKSDRSEQSVFNELLGTWRSEVHPDDESGVLQDGFIDIEEIEEVTPARGIIRRGKRRPPMSGGTGGGEFDIADSTVTRASIFFILMIKRKDTSGAQEYAGSVIRGTRTCAGRATFVRREARGHDKSQEQGSWVATKQG